MDIFNTVISVHVCAASEEERQRGRKLFERLVGAGNTVERQGFWMTDREPALVVEHWFDNDDPSATARVKRVLRFARLWQAAAKQTAVLVTVVSPHGQKALVIYEGDWSAAWNELAPLVDRGEWLAAGFERGGTW